MTRQAYKLVKYGDPVLKTPATDVVAGDEVRSLVQAMKSIMYQAEGLGIAAQQVGATKRVCIMRLSNAPFDAKRPVVALNLRLFRKRGTTFSLQEGCLSVRNDQGIVWRRDVERAAEVTATWQEEPGGPEIEHKLTGQDAIIAQHEHDHLEGRCIADESTAEERKAYYKDYREKNWGKKEWANAQRTTT